MDVDISQSLKIGSVRDFYFMECGYLAFLCIAGVALAVALAAAGPTILIIVPLLSLPVFLFGALLSYQRMTTLNGPIITFSTNGFSDARLPHVGLIPWSAITSVSAVRQTRGGRYFVLQVEPIFIGNVGRPWLIWPPQRSRSASTAMLMRGKLPVLTFLIAT